MNLAFHEKGREFVLETLKQFKMPEAYKPKGQEDDGNGKGKLLYTINPMPGIRVAMGVERIPREKDEFEMDEDGNLESMKDGEGYQKDELDEYHPPYLKQAMGYTLKLLGGAGPRPQRAVPQGSACDRAIWRGGGSTG